MKLLLKLIPKWLKKSKKEEKNIVAVSGISEKYKSFIAGRIEAGDIVPKYGSDGKVLGYTVRRVKK